MEFALPAAKPKITRLLWLTAAVQLGVLAAGAAMMLSVPGQRVAMPAAAPETTAWRSESPNAASDIERTQAPEESDAEVVIYRAPSIGATLAAQAFKKAGVPLNTLRTGEQIELQISPASDITAMRKRLAEGKVLILDGDSSKGYDAKVIKPEAVESEKTVSGTIVHSFSHSAQRANLPQNVMDELVDLFSGQVEFRKDLQPGDAFVVVFDQYATSEGDFIKAGPIKSALIEKGGRTLYAVRHAGNNGKAHYYDAEGKPFGDCFLRYPLQFSRISSAFSYGRFHPILKKVLPHNGIDFAAPLGTPVRAVADGFVTKAGYSIGGGKSIKIRHGDRYSTAYLHLNQFSARVRSGAKVARGEIIGTVGSTGLSTGAHLHFSFYDRGKYVNPLKMALPSNALAYEAIPRGYLQAQIARLQQSQGTVKLAWARKAERSS
jgi:murein DD-endopeptidase MepM/ murein hydrolase activator NlpD